MAKPVDFEGRVGRVFVHDDCDDLPTHEQAYRLAGQKTNEIISAWKLSVEEMEQIIANDGVVFLGIIGNGLPPVYVTGFNPIRSDG